MAMMAKMRSLAPAFIISVGAIFVLFMIISDSNVQQAFTERNSRDIGLVNGQKITYVEFNNLVDQQMKNQRQQTGRDLEEADVDQLRDQVWESLVTQKLIAQQIDKMGITVSDQEVRDIILGENPPDFLKQNFIDSTGRFNRTLYDQALQDARNREPVIEAENIVRQQRLSEKLQSMVTASINISDQEITRRFMDQNVSMNVLYSLVDVSKMPDKDFKVTDDELRDYYNRNVDKFTIKAQRKLKYVLFPTTPSAEDTANVKAALENVVNNIKTDTAGFKANVEIYSSEPYSKDTLPISAFGEAAANKLANTAPGTIVGPFESPQGYAVYNFLGKVPGNENMVHVSHILVNQFGSDEKNLEKANEIYNQVNAGADFSKLAMQYSADPGSARKGGDLGWFGKGAMVAEFEKASFDGKVGVVQKPVKTSFGFHIIKVLGRSSDKYIVEKIINPVKTSPSTRDAQQNAAKDFQYLADKNGFEKEAQLIQYKVQETPPFVEESYAVPGIGMNKNLLKFAFSGDLNDVSEVHRIPSGYVVAKISEVIKEGAQEFDKIKDQIKPAVIKEKKIQKAAQIAADLSKQINGDLLKAAQLNPYVVVDTTGKFTGNGSVKNIGREYGFIAKAQELELNKVSAPVKGTKGYYLMKVIERTPFDKQAFDIQKEGIRQSLLQEKRNAFFTQWLANLKKAADVEDSRYMFYGY